MIRIPGNNLVYYYCTKVPKKITYVAIHTIGQFVLDRMIFFITKPTSVQFFQEEEKQDRIGWKLFSCIQTTSDQRSPCISLVTWLLVWCHPTVMCVCAVIRPTATKPTLVRRSFEYVNITFDQLTPSRGRRTGNVWGGGYVSEQWVCGSSVTIGPLPDYPQTTVDKVASVIELDFTWLIVCLLVGKYSNLSPHPPLAPYCLLSY